MEPLKAESKEQNETIIDDIVDVILKILSIIKFFKKK